MGRSGGIYFLLFFSLLVRISGVSITPKASAFYPGHSAGKTLRVQCTSASFLMRGLPWGACLGKLERVHPLHL